MISCQLQWHRCCDVNVGAVTGLLTSNHNVLHPCTVSLSLALCSPHSVGASPGSRRSWLAWYTESPCRDGVAVASICFLSCSLGSSIASCPLLAPGKWAWCAQAVCLQRQQTPSHLKVHLSLEHGCSNHCDDSTKIVTEFLLSCYLNSTRSALTYTLGQCFPHQKCCENPSRPWSHMTSISFFEKQMKCTGIESENIREHSAQCYFMELLLHEYVSLWGLHSFPVAPATNCQTL